jgi:hypothetical protein
MRAIVPRRFAASAVETNVLSGVILFISKVSVEGEKSLWLFVRAVHS